jgi:hypothetical protein
LSPPAYYTSWPPLDWISTSLLPTRPAPFPRVNWIPTITRPAPPSPWEATPQLALCFTAPLVVGLRRIGRWVWKPTRPTADGLPPSSGPPTRLTASPPVLWPPRVRAHPGGHPTPPQPSPSFDEASPRADLCQRDAASHAHPPHPNSPPLPSPFHHAPFYDHPPERTSNPSQNMICDRPRVKLLWLMS